MTESTWKILKLENSWNFFLPKEWEPCQMTYTGMAELLQLVYKMGVPQLEMCYITRISVSVRNWNISRVT